MSITKRTDSSLEQAGGARGAIIPIRSSETRNPLSEEDRRFLNWHKDKRNELRKKLRNLDVEACLEAYRLGDRLGAHWESGQPLWKPVSYHTILRFGKRFPAGTDESDTVDCFQRFIADYRYQDDLNDFLVSWARYHQRNRRATSYGGTWKDYFATVKALDRKGELSVERLFALSAERKPGGSAGNGCLALALPAYAYARQVGAHPFQMVSMVMRLSHGHPTVQVCARFLCHLFDTVQGLVSEDAHIEGAVCRCKALCDYYGREVFPKPAGYRYPMEHSPADFIKLYPDNLLCGNTLVHALYAVHTSENRKDLITKVVSMGGDVDSVLALAMMLWRMFYPISPREVAFAIGHATSLDSREDLQPEGRFRCWYI